MKHDLKALRDLDKRLAEAKGPHRELDAAIFNALPFDDGGFRAYKEDNCTKLEAWGFEPRFFDGWVIRRTTVLDDNYPDPLDKFTASLDAAVALVERVLWGRGLLIGRGRTRPSEPLWGAQILASDENEECREMPILAEAESDTAALALCLACVRALIAQGEVTP